MAWRFLANRLNGDGTETPLGTVPISGPELTEDLSGPGGLTGTITPEIAELKTKNGPLLEPWSTAIYAEADGIIRGGWILDELPEDGPNLQLDAVGFTGYAGGMPYTGERSRIGTDPLTEARHIWDHLQEQQDGNLGLELDRDTTSPVRIGTEEKTNDFTTGAGETVSFESGPYRLNWFTTDNLGQEFDKLAAETPFDYRVDHFWDGNRIRHKLVFGYPRLGRRLNGPGHRFAVGENITTVPPLGRGGEDYASEVLLLGAGEGRKMIRGTAAHRTGRLRRVRVLEDKAQRSKKAADAAAARILQTLSGDPELAEDITIANHPHAPLGSYRPGDEILVHTRPGWSPEQALWVRILSTTIHPATDTVTATVIRAEKVS